MRRGALRIRIGDGGELEIVDPGLAEAALLSGIDRNFAIRSAPLWGFTRPRLLGLRTQATPVNAAAADALALRDLWAVHDAALGRWRENPNGGGDAVAYAPVATLSLLDLKRLIARRLLGACVLCARRCGVDRAAGRTGLCGLSAEAYVFDHFVHIAEEPQINPSFVLNLRGCALRCRGCQQSGLLDTRGAAHERLVPDLWGELALDGARSLSLVGGNPDESLAAILDFLAAAPEDFALPIVWNNHAYMSGEVIRLLQGVVDVYVPDLKFGAETCAQPYTRVQRYAAVAQEAIGHLLEHGVPVIVRILVLPGHGACCHVPSLAWLAAHDSENLFVSLRGHYAPDWRITARDGPLAGRVAKEELDAVTAVARAHGLRLVGES